MLTETVEKVEHLAEEVVLRDELERAVPLH